MLGRPHNDRECLDAIMAEIETKLASGDLDALAAQYPDTDALIEDIRARPQRDDEGLPCDGPKVTACRPAQRLRLPADDGNCVERAAEFVALAERIDPGPMRRLATVETPNGLHTFPTEDGVPVILDPMVSRNALRAGLSRIGRNAVAGGRPAREAPHLRYDRVLRRMEEVRDELDRVLAWKAQGHSSWADGRPFEVVIAAKEREIESLAMELDGLSRNALRGADPDVATRRLRLERLIGTDPTKGVRGDLARARAARERGHTTWVDGRPIDEAIATYERALATYRERLDALPRNAACPAGSPAVVALTPMQAIDWCAELAAEPAARFVGGTRRVRNGHHAMRAVLVGRPLCVAEVGDVAFVLALAEREARMWGAPGQRIVRTCAHAIDQLDQAAARRWLDERAPRNRAELRLGHYKIRPNTPLLAALGRVGARIGGNVATQAIRIKLASMGVTPPVLSTIEQELNREGLSLGPLAAPPPMLGSLAALTPDAIAGRWLASRI